MKVKSNIWPMSLVFSSSLCYTCIKKKDILYIDFHTANWVGLINQGFDLGCKGHVQTEFQINK